ncbi:MAG: PQQ-dependent sugar dehydrogenase [Gammaproteobacteria bacterium]|nr:PQQ-dependent sugar dehydrogenase [Gammaproteobacteria bacterium]
MRALHNKSAKIAVLLLIAVAPLAANATDDSDGDGVLDLTDNCLEVGNADQRNTDGDRYGNICDPDFDNDEDVDFFDLAQLKAAFLLPGDLDEDMNGDSVVNFPDVDIFKTYFLATPGPAGPLSGGGISLAVTQVFTSISVSNPMAMKQAPGDSTSWYVAERSGRILRFDNVAAPSGTVEVLDITDRVDTFFEGGLLGFAFDPKFETNGRIFVSYTTTGSSSQTNPLDSRVSMFGPDAAEPGSFDESNELIILEFDQPFGNHNGSDIEFGPDDLLYTSFGDGGSFNDPLDNGQDKTSFQGTILRLDVDLTPQDIIDGIKYRIPPGNPYSANSDCTTACPEIFAHGFRNPWRFSFDSETDEFYVGDVGQDAREEIDIVTVGENHGWRCYEGNLQFNLSGCEPIGTYTFPVIDYSHSVGASVTGGYVYHGTDFPALDGVYLYGDYVSGRIWGLFGGKDLGELINTSLDLVSFAQSHDGEVYVLDLFPGAIYRVEVTN